MACATNVGNKDGQVAMSVITFQEGYLGLTSMIDGIIQHYTSADVLPPEVLYVVKECCGELCVRKLFDAWRDLKLRLDIWHFMRLGVLQMHISCRGIYESAV